MPISAMQRRKHALAGGTPLLSLQNSIEIQACSWDKELMLEELILR